MMTMGRKRHESLQDIGDSLGVMIWKSVTSENTAGIPAGASNGDGADAGRKTPAALDVRPCAAAFQRRGFGFPASSGTTMSSVALPLGISVLNV